MYSELRNKVLKKNIKSKEHEKKSENNLCNNCNNLLKQKNISRNKLTSLNSLDKLNGKLKIFLTSFNKKIKNDNNKVKIYKNMLIMNKLSKKDNNKPINLGLNKTKTKFILKKSNFNQNNENAKNNNPISALFTQNNYKNINLNESNSNSSLNKRYSLTQIPNIKYNTINPLLNNLNNISKRKFRNSVISNPNLKDKISQLIKEISNKEGKEIHIKKYKKIKSRNKNRIKSIDSMAKKNRNKFFNLLNKDGSLNSFLKTMKFKKTDNIFNNYAPKGNKLFKIPKNTEEMNRLLFNSFALNKEGSNGYSKTLYSLYENFFSIKNEMKKAKAEMDLQNINKNENKVINIESIKKEEEEWEKKFMLNMYKNKLSEKEFKNFKKMNKIQQKKEIMRDSLQLADNIMKMDADEYEIPNELYEFRSTRSYISNRNVHRIRRIKRIMENIEDKEQLGIYDVNVEKLKKNQKKSETESMLAIKRAGKPRFVKTQFKSSTISKYKGISGDFFGLPA